MSVNSLTPTGLTTAGILDIINQILNGGDGYPGLNQIYGPGLNVNPNSPDGNMVQIYAQAAEDNLELVAQVFASFDPDQAVGVVLNARCAFNGVFRQGPTFTQQLVSVTNTVGTTLPGLDDFPNGGAFTIQDAQGNQYALTVTTTTIAGIQPMVFQAVQSGPVSSPANTITTIVTPLAGVISVTNTAVPYNIGTYEETDSALRIRRQQQVAAPGRSWFGSLQAQLLAIAGITGCEIVENRTGGVVGGVPANGIWVIVAGSNTTTPNGGTQQAVANAMFNGATAGCAMKGAITVDVVQPDGAIYAAMFDFATKVQIYFRATITAITGTVDEVFIAQQILAQFGNAYDVNTPADATSIVAFIKSIAPNASVTNEAVSLDNATWVAIVTPAAVNDQLYIPVAGNITLS